MIRKKIAVSIQTYYTHCVEGVKRGDRADLSYRHSWTACARILSCFPGSLVEIHRCRNGAKIPPTVMGRSIVLMLKRAWSNKAKS